MVGLSEEAAVKNGAPVPALAGGGLTSFGRGQRSPEGIPLTRICCVLPRFMSPYIPTVCRSSSVPLARSALVQDLLGAIKGRLGVSTRGQDGVGAHGSTTFMYDV
jgi:hypothetical protein